MIERFRIWLTRRLLAAARITDPGLRYYFDARRGYSFDSEWRQLTRHDAGMQQTTPSGGRDA